MAASRIPALAPEGNLNSYLQQIRKFPMLELNEEYMLAKAWREKGHTESAHKLVTSHLRLVAKIAMGYRGYGLPVSELISEPLACAGTGTLQHQRQRHRSGDYPHRQAR